MSQPVIEAQNVSMMFNLSTEKVDSIKEYAILKLKNQLRYRQFWALRDISFTVNKGEHIGIVGLNGSGKSTLLKIIAGVLKPTEGTVSVTGSVAPLIELGAGFDMNLSARENIFLNGAILGYSHKTMLEHYDSIVEFAELEDFQDVAIKNFSSGMVARLGFSIATIERPEVLIVDEILSVGDYAFQQKCKRKMADMTGRGTTVLFVSHSVTQVTEICNKALWLKGGQQQMWGEAQEVCDAYIASL